MGYGYDMAKNKNTLQAPGASGPAARGGVRAVGRGAVMCGWSNMVYVVRVRTT